MSAVNPYARLLAGDLAGAVESGAQNKLDAHIALDDVSNLTIQKVGPDLRPAGETFEECARHCPLNARDAQPCYAACAADPL